MAEFDTSHLLGEICIRGQIFSVLKKPFVFVGDIRKLVARHHQLSEKELLEDTKVRYIVRPRQEAMWLTKRLTTASLPQIGRWFKSERRFKDHATVIHALRTIDRLIDNEGEAVANDLLSLLPKFPNVVSGKLGWLQTEFRLPIDFFAEFRRWFIAHNEDCPHGSQTNEAGAGQLTYSFTPLENSQHLRVSCICGANIELK